MGKVSTSEKTTDWRPLSVRLGKRPDYDTLHGGVPPWLAQSLEDWAMGLFRWENDRHQVFFDEKALHELEWRLKLSMRLDWSAPARALMSLHNHMFDSPDVFLDVVEFVLFKSADDSSHTVERLSELERILEAGGSAWRVSTRGAFPHLEARVDATVVAAAERVMADAGRAGEYLQNAWSKIYGRHPDPSAGYGQSVNAVEAAARPVVSPNDATTTLGKIIGQVRQNPQAWTIEVPAPPAFERGKVLLGMLDLLWKGHADRHGTPDPNVPISVSQSEAEAALHLAVTLVHWFNSGAVRHS